MTARRFCIGFLFAALLSGCGSGTADVRRDAVPVQLAAPDGRTVTVSVALARTPEEQRTGLMGRSSLVADAGMLFIFQESSVQSFWMKNTLVPLDIIFFDASGSVVSSASMVPCPAESVTCPFTLSQAPARFALEVPGGFLLREGITRDWNLLLGPWAQDS